MNTIFSSIPGLFSIFISLKDEILFITSLTSSSGVEAPEEIPIDSNQSYFDTNVTDHHHFYDISEKKLIDLDEVDVGPINIQKSIPGKKIKSVEVLVKLDTDNQ